MLPFCAEGTQGYLTGSKRERESAALPENISRALNREPRKGHGYSEGRVFERGLAYNVAPVGSGLGRDARYARMRAEWGTTAPGAGPPGCNERRPGPAEP